jgi:hypothetical protein
MLINTQCLRAGLVSAILSFMLMLAISAVAMVQPTLAQNGASQTAPPPQTGPAQYWTPEKMREAKPAMPTVPGTPQSSSSTPGPNAPSGGAPGQGPQVQPNSGSR